MNRLRRFVLGFGQGFGLGRVICLVLLVALVALRIGNPAPLESLRFRTFDFYQSLKPRIATLQPAVIVDIDDASLKAFGQWPWPRTLLADLVAKLGKLGSAVIAETMRRTRVVLGESGHHMVVPPSGPRPPPVGFATLGPDPRPFLFGFPGVISNVPALENAAAGRGLFNVQPEADGIIRRVPMVQVAQDILMPALSLEMLRVATGAGGIRIKTDAAGISSVAIPGLELPTDRNGQLWVYFAPSTDSRYVSAKDVLEDRVPPDRFNRRLALVGTSAVGLRDIKATPINPAMSGVEIHAQVLENVLTKSMLVYPNYAIGAELAAAVLFGLAIIAIGPILGATTMLALGLFLTAGLAGGSWYFFSEQRILIDATYPLLSTFLIYLTLIFINYFREQLQRRRIRSAFGQYLSPSLVDKLAHSHETLTLGGEDRNMTIMFSDVRGFTSISEMYKDDPQGLTTLMNNFLTPMTNAIVENNGTIDKYIGDAIMAFWSAPLHDDDHEINGCSAALEMLARVDIINIKREQEAVAAGTRFIPIKIGVGLNSGRCVVGNMGSDLRFNYSVLGDCVNLASRLEGQTKSYDVPIIIGSKTAQKARDKFAILEVDYITVKGKTEPETIYTILGREDVARSENFIRVKTLFDEMLVLYRRQDFAAAGEAIVRCRAAGEGFGLSRLFDIYSLRIGGFEKQAPPSDWNGVFALETK
jgi:adenylate cyclase